MSDDRYGDYEQVNGAVANGLLDQIEDLTKQLAQLEEEANFVKALALELEVDVKDLLTIPQIAKALAALPDSEVTE